MQRAYNARANAGIEKLLALIDTNGKRSEVDSLLPLVRRKASLVAEEKAFKASCKAKRIQLEQEIEDLKANPPEPGGGGRAEEQEAARKDAVTERDSLKHVSAVLSFFVTITKVRASERRCCKTIQMRTQAPERCFVPFD